jgi:hypothetical protein
MKIILSTITITCSLAMLLFGFVPQEVQAVTMEYVPTYTDASSNMQVTSLRWYYDAKRWPKGHAAVYIKDVNGVFGARKCGGNVEGWIIDGDYTLQRVCDPDGVNVCGSYLASKPTLLGDVDCGIIYVTGNAYMQRFDIIELFGTKRTVNIVDPSAQAKYLTLNLNVLMRNKVTLAYELKGTVKMSMKLNRVW